MGLMPILWQLSPIYRKGIDMNRLTDTHLIMINKHIAERERLIYGVKNKETLMMLAQDPYTLDEHENFYVYKDNINKAVRIGYLLATKQPFLSCNIKTALVTMVTQLKLNNATLCYDKGELPVLIELIQKGDEDGIYLWVSDHVEP